MSTITNFRQSLNNFCQLPATTSNQSITNKTTGKHVDLYLYGIIGTHQINDKTVLQAITGNGQPDTIKVYINTVGGSFSAGLAIYNTLKQNPAHVTTVNMGYALSMGSLILMAGDVVECADNGLLMLHRSQGLSFGDVDDHSKAIAAQKQHDQSLITTYRKRLAKSDDAIMKLLKAETWYTAQQAKTAGLIDTITGSVTLDKAGAESGASNVHVTNFRNPPPGFKQLHNIGLLPS